MIQRLLCRSTGADPNVYNLRCDWLVAEPRWVSAGTDDPKVKKGHRRLSTISRQGSAFCGVQHVWVAKAILIHRFGQIVKRVRRMWPTSIMGPFACNRVISRGSETRAPIRSIGILRDSGKAPVLVSWRSHCGSCRPSSG